MQEVKERALCKRCNRVLRGQKSVEAGIGPVCKRKMDREKEAEQIEFGEVGEIKGIIEPQQG